MSERITKILVRGCILLTIALQPVASRASAQPAPPVEVALGRAAVALNGPWKFHTGDDPKWATANFDDSTWESIDLTPPPGAHDSDVGLKDYVPGWQAKGHRGYSGFAWYRIRVHIDAPRGEFLSLCGPFYVDNAYQLFVNGQLLGGSGGFSGPAPTAYNPHLPRIFRLPGEAGGELVIAVRSWMGPFMLPDPEAGGIHIAPSIGTAEGSGALYRSQWMEMFAGYVVDATEGLLFLLLAIMVCTLIPFDRSDPAYLWLAAALVLSAIARGNQAVFFWWEFESIRDFEMIIIVLTVPLSIAAWTVAWWKWLRLRGARWIVASAAALAATYIAAQFLRRSWFYGALPHWVGTVAFDTVLASRLAFVVLTLMIIGSTLVRKGSEKWLAFPAIVLISIGLFAQEISMLHVPGIWFPFGTGVSRTEYAYAAFDVVLFALLLHRLYSFRRSAAAHPSPDAAIAGTG